jgi:putative hydrolase of the HAD superfamily
VTQRDVRHVLLDADGVVQRSTNLGGEIDALTEHLGDGTTEFLTRTFPPDGPVLSGRAEVVPLLAEALLANGSDADAQRLYDDLWLEIEVSAESLAVARALRGSGVGVHLATNQDLHRAAYMKAELGYDEVFDSAFYSSDLGWAKPSAEFFTHAVDALGASPDEVLFVDDSQANVDGARAAGLRAERWEIGEGIDSLRALLSAHGLTVT